MAGLLLIALMIGYAALTVWLLVKVKPIWGKVVMLLTAILIPTTDDIYYRRQLEAYCKTQAGYKIYDQVSKTMAVKVNLAGEGLAPKSPLAVVEFHDDVLNKTYRYDYQPDGTFKKTLIDKITAPYEFIRKETHTGTFLELELLVKHRKTNEKLGQFFNLYYYGGWWRRGVLGSMADSGPTLVADCGYEGKAPENELLKRIFSKD